MSALITTAIGQQGFERVRDAIGAILLLELLNQKSIQEFNEEIVIYQERILPMSTEDNLYFNVLLDNATYSQKTPTDSQGLTIYNVDVYTTGLNSDATTGSFDSAQRLQKFLGMCRFILDSTFYKTLGFAPGLIGGAAVQSINMLDQPTHNEDGTYGRFGRLVYAVRIQENQSLWAGVTLNINNTSVTLDETDKGYVYRLSQ